MAAQRAGRIAGLLGLALVVGLLMSGCGHGPSSPAPAPPAPTASATPLPPGTLEVTLANDGQTLHMTVGERLLLRLGEGYDWTVTVSDPSVLSGVVGVLLVRGAQGLYQADRAGQAILSAIGDPPCRKVQPPCAAPSRAFQLTVAVQ